MIIIRFIMNLLFILPSFIILHSPHGLLRLLHCSTRYHWNRVSEELQHNGHGLCKYSKMLTHSHRSNDSILSPCLAHTHFLPSTMVGYRSAQAVHRAACALKAWCQMEQEAASTRPAVHVCTMEMSTSLDRHWLRAATPGLYSALNTHQYNTYLLKVLLVF